MKDIGESYICCGTTTDMHFHRVAKDGKGWKNDDVFGAFARGELTNV